MDRFYPIAGVFARYIIAKEKGRREPTLSNVIPVKPAPNLIQGSGIHLPCASDYPPPRLSPARLALLQHGEKVPYQRHAVKLFLPDGRFLFAGHWRVSIVTLTITLDEIRGPFGREVQRQACLERLPCASTFKIARLADAIGAARPASTT
ncbi:MAG: hypothetical protein ACT4N8_10170 [Sphingosinicella sp.]